MSSTIPYLGLLIQKPDLISNVSLHSSDFIIQEHRQLFDAITSLFSKGVLINKDKLAAAAALNPDWVAHVAQQGYGQDIEQFLGYEQDIRRGRAIHDAQLVANEINNPRFQPEDIQRAINQLGQISIASSADVMIRDDYVEMLKPCDQSKSRIRLTCGYPKLDSLLGGLVGGRLIILAARPAMGKTAMMINMMNATSIPIGLISSEQQHEEIAARSASMLTGVQASVIQNRQMTDEEITQISNLVARSGDQIQLVNDKGRISITEVESQARVWFSKFKINALFVDYLQRLDGVGQSTVERVSNITRRLKSLAKELDIPVIALAQVKRSVDERTGDGRSPMIGDLSDASEIEKEADQILTLYREAGYENTNDNRAMVTVVKNRHGKTGRVFFRFVGEYFRFTEI